MVIGVLFERNLRSFQDLLLLHVTWFELH